MTEQDELLSTKTDLALIKRDIQQIQDVLKRMDTVIAQLADVITTIAVQEKMFETSDKRFQLLEEDLDKQSDAVINLEKDLKKQLKEMEAKSEQDREARHKEVLALLQAIEEKVQSRNEAHDKRLSSLEQWRYYILGAIAAGMFFVSQIDWPKLF